jgi:hypothetical protein
MITFNGLKLEAATAPGGGVVGPETGTVTGARRGAAAGGGGGACLVRTIVTSSGSSLTLGVDAVVAIFAGIGANCASPEAIVRSSINSATVW